MKRREKDLLKGASIKNSAVASNHNTSLDVQVIDPTTGSRPGVTVLNGRGNQAGIENYTASRKSKGSDLELRRKSQPNPR